MHLRTDGARLRQLRLLKGLTAKEFASRAGYTPTYVSQVERGRCNAGVRYLRTAAEILDCQIADITTVVVPPTDRPAQQAS